MILSTKRGMRLVCVVLLSGAAWVAPAQAVSQSSLGPSLEASVGLSRGVGGAFYQRGGGAADVLFAAPLAESAAGTVVGGLSAALQGPFAVDNICALGPDGECLDSFPLFFSAAALAGVQRGSATGPSARLMAGPAFYVAGDGGRSALGLQGRLDVATAPLLPHTSVVASLRGAVLPSYEGDAVGTVSFGLGLRIQ